MAQTFLNILSTDNELFRIYLVHCSILVIKILFMTLFTGIQRFKHLAFMNPEDASVLKVKPKIDDNVERVRRAHLNDVESIPIFFLASFAYILTNPSTETATCLFRIFTASRLLHTFVYAIYVIPQPARVLSFTVGALVTFYMAAKSIIHFM